MSAELQSFGRYPLHPQVPTACRWRGDLPGALRSAQRQHGTFGCHVRRFGLVRSDVGAVVCSPAERPELFAATIGGLGLTGLIEWAEIQLVPIRSSRIDGLTRR